MSLYKCCFYTRRLSLPLVQVLIRSQSTVDARTDTFKVRPFKDIPGPKGLPYVGSVHRYMMDEGFDKIHKVHQKLFDEFGPIFKETLFGKTMVHVLGPVDTEKVFRSEGKYPQRGPLKSLIRACKEVGISGGIGISEGAEWKRYRQALSSKMLRPREMRDNIGNFYDVVDDALKNIRQARGEGNSEGEVSTLDEELAKWATESIGTLVFDARIGLYEDPPRNEPLRFIKAVNDLFECLHNLEVGPEKMFFTKFNTPSFKKLCQAIDVIRASAQIYMDVKREELKEDLNNPDKLLDGEVVPLLTYLLVKSDLTPEEINHAALDMFAAGVDTTSTAMLWALYALAKNPEVQERLHQEIVSVIGKDGYLTARDLGKIPYTKAFLKESLRFDSISFANSRILDQDIVLSGYNVPAGIQILSSIYASSRTESYFKDPEEFKPERWLRETGDQFHPFSYLPFGFGLRMCIGNYRFGVFGVLHGISL
ncbi:hypothetical protein QZH41_015124 [Actinostola sp. cb2023]|nr:hypothetical protein QZH41_015124 [Actinostola sp. cb2023]